MVKVPQFQNDPTKEAALEMGSIREFQPASSHSKFSGTLQEEIDQFQPVAFCYLRRESKPRVWFIKLICWPYPLIFCMFCLTQLRMERATVVILPLTLITQSIL